MENHLLTIYGKKNKVKEQFLIEDRSSDEATKEAMSYVENVQPNCSDWSLELVIERTDAIKQLGLTVDDSYSNDLLQNDWAEKFDETRFIVHSFKTYKKL